MSPNHSGFAASIYTACCVVSDAHRETLSFGLIEGQRDISPRRNFENSISSKPGALATQQHDTLWMCCMLVCHCYAPSNVLSSPATTYVSQEQVMDVYAYPVYDTPFKNSIFVREGSIGALIASFDALLCSEPDARKEIETCSLFKG